MSGTPDARWERLAAAGANLTLCLPGRPPIAIGTRPDAARVVFHTAEAAAALDRGDHLALAEAFLHGRIDVEGALLEIMKVTDQLALAARPLDRVRSALRFLLRDRQQYDRETVAFHYDRPPEFFLPWLDRWRCYSHGLYARPDEPIADAIARKMQTAIDALGLAPGMDVLDMGGGWGCFVEYAGLQGIRVHSITISAEQHRFVEALIAERHLPCTTELVHLNRYRPPVLFDGAVFMGTLEHNPDYAAVTRFLVAHLKPPARVWADFCAQRTDFQGGRFVKKYIWPGSITYVDPVRLLRTLVRAGFNVHELADDTLSYACSVRDWAVAMEACRASLAAAYGEPVVRAFLLFLRGSEHFLTTNRTQAYHVVAGRDPSPLRRATPSSAGA